MILLLITTSYRFFNRLEVSSIKTIQCSLNIGKHDLERKMKQAQGFLKKRQQVRVTLILKGREKYSPERGVEFLNEIHETFLDEFGRCAKMPTTQNLSLTYNPR